jgi:uncharacterized protein YdaU (DUF1376 family)
MRTHCLRSADEVSAAVNVLKDFFYLDEKGYSHKRCDVEIEAFHGKSKSASDSAKARWDRVRCERNANALNPHCEGNANHKPLTINQEPITKNHKPETKDSKPSKVKNLAPAKADAEDTELQSACKATWIIYSRAYFNRYGTEPTRNAGVNSMIKQFVKKMPYMDAPMVAEFFVSHNDRFYVQKIHPVSLMSKDAEGLRTQWATGRGMTATRATQIDKSQANASCATEAMAIYQRMEAERAEII